MSKKMIDVTIYMDAVTLEEGETAETIIDYLKERFPIPWGYVWEVTHEEIVDD